MLTTKYSGTLFLIKVYCVKVKSVTINPGCITCGSCEFIAPEVFEVTTVSQVRQNASIAQHSEAIVKAARACPVQVIAYEHE
jgi:ferredoxin